MDFRMNAQPAAGSMFALSGWSPTPSTLPDTAAQPVRRFRAVVDHGEAEVGQRYVTSREEGDLTIEVDAVEVDDDGNRYLHGRVVEG